MNVVFDLDGTLTDPGKGFVASIAYALSKVGADPVQEAEVLRHVGPPLEDTLRALLGPASPHIGPAVSFYRERYGRVGYLENSVYAGIEAALEALAAGGATLFVATSKPEVFANRILGHFGLSRFFRRICGSGLDGTRAGKAALLSHLVSIESLLPGATVVVGDRAQDVIGARANQLASIGVLWGYGTRDELTAAGASAICERPGELPGVLSSDGRQRPTPAGAANASSRTRR